MSAAFTPGPWKFACDSYGKVRHSRKACVYTTKREPGGEMLVTIAARIPEWSDARLIAAAPDHADIGWAMCVAAGRWEPWGGGRGEFILNGIAFSTKLDPFGIPEVTPAMRAQIAKARGES